MKKIRIITNLVFLFVFCSCSLISKKPLAKRQIIPPSPQSFYLKEKEIRKISEGMALAQPKTITNKLNFTWTKTTYYDLPLTYNLYLGTNSGSYFISFNVGDTNNYTLNRIITKYSNTNFVVNINGILLTNITYLFFNLTAKTSSGIFSEFSNELKWPPIQLPPPNYIELSWGVTKRNVNILYSSNLFNWYSFTNVINGTNLIVPLDNSNMSFRGITTNLPTIFLKIKPVYL